MNPPTSLDIQTASFGDATNQVIADATNGQFDGIADYAMFHLGPGCLLAMLGLGIVFVGYMFAKYVSRIVSGPVRKRVDETLGRFVGKAVFYTIMFGVVGAVLSKMGAPLGGLAAMLAAAGFAVGLAFQGTLSNFAAGVLMLVFRPFKVGDFVNAGGVSGTVNEIDLFTTTLDTPDNRRIIVPNSSIAGGTIENVSFHAHRRVEVLVGVDYKADIETTRAALEAAVTAHAAVMIGGEGRGGQVVLASLGDSAVNWKVRMWVDKANYWSINESLTAAVKIHLDSANIGIPFPQMDVHIDGAVAMAKLSSGASESHLETNRSSMSDDATGHRRSDSSSTASPRTRPQRRVA